MLAATNRKVRRPSRRRAWSVPRRALRFPLSEMRRTRSNGVTQDALGSVRAITDNTGAVVSHFELDAWGNVLASSVDGVPGGFYYRFVGGLGCRLDPATGLVYMRQRWYDGSVQRFVSRDPQNSGASNRTPRLGKRAGRQLHPLANLYTYGANNPLKFVDPYGTWIWVTTAGGTRSFSTTQDFISYVRSAGNGSITSVVFEGHGDSTSQNFDFSNPYSQSWTDYVTVQGKDVRILGPGTNASLSDLLANKLSPDSSVWFHGCDTASGTCNLPSTLYDSLKGRVPGIVTSGNTTSSRGSSEAGPHEWDYSPFTRSYGCERRSERIIDDYIRAGGGGGTW